MQFFKNLNVTVKLALLVCLVIACEMLFLAYSEDMNLDQEAVLEGVEFQATQVAGVGWTDLMPVWFINFFAANDAQADVQVAGVGWTDLMPVWFINFFAANDAQADVQVAGVGWTDLMPVWIVRLFV